MPGRFLQAPRCAAMLVIEMHKVLEHPHEGCAFARLERREFVVCCC
jgi:hypothetical protein